MSTSRRRKEYCPIGKDPKFNPYHDAFDKERMASKIINPSANRPGINFQWFDEHGIRNEKAKIEEEYIPAIIDRLDEIEEEFANLQQTQINEGREMAKEMPTEMFEEKLICEAKLDVRQEELILVNKKLREFDEREEEEEDDLMLRYGLVESGHFWGLGAPRKELINVLHDIDGQQVRQNGTGLLIIKDKRSPYNGMSVVDYRKLAKEWKGERQKAYLIKHKQYLKDVENGLNAQMPYPPSGVIDRAELPPFPKWAVNHLKEPEFKRTKKKKK